MAILLQLFAAHALCDFPLQGDFLAKGKNHRSGIPGIPWFPCLFAHALIHAGAVYLVTRSEICAAGEMGFHMIIDFAKCEGDLSFNQDQCLHYALKVLWTVLYFYGVM